MFCAVIIVIILGETGPLSGSECTSLAQGKLSHYLEKRPHASCWFYQENAESLLSFPQEMPSNYCFTHFIFLSVAMELFPEV